MKLLACYFGSVIQPAFLYARALARHVGRLKSVHLKPPVTFRESVASSAVATILQASNVLRRVRYKRIERRVWTVDDIRIILDEETTEDPVATAIIVFPGGELLIMAEVSRAGRQLHLGGLHLHSSTGPNTLGTVKLRVLAQLAMEFIDVDEIVVSGATRTTGANPGRRPGIQRYKRIP